MRCCMVRVQSNWRTCILSTTEKRPLGLVWKRLQCSGVCVYESDADPVGQSSLLQHGACRMHAPCECIVAVFAMRMLMRDDSVPTVCVPHVHLAFHTACFRRLVCDETPRCAAPHASAGGHPEPGRERGRDRAATHTPWWSSPCAPTAARAGPTPPCKGAAAAGTHARRPCTQTLRPNAATLAHKYMRRLTLPVTAVPVSHTRPPCAHLHHRHIHQPASSKQKAARFRALLHQARGQRRPAFQQATLAARGGRFE